MTASRWSQWPSGVVLKRQRPAGHHGTKSTEQDLTRQFYRAWACWVRSFADPMATLLDGRSLAADIERRLAAVVAAGRPVAGRPPGLAVLRVGDDPASGVYVANKQKACARVGIGSHGAHLPAQTPAEELLAVIRRLNDDPAVDGILLQLPLPGGMAEGPLLAAIDPDKDADGLHTLNLGRLLKGESRTAQLHPGRGDGPAEQCRGADPAEHGRWWWAAASWWASPWP